MIGKCNNCCADGPVATCKKCGYKMCSYCIMENKAKCPRCNIEKVIFT